MRMTGWLQGLVLMVPLAAAQAQEAPFSTRQQFLDGLESRQEQNRRSMGTNEQEILTLERGLARESADESRAQSDLLRLNTMPGGSGADEWQRAEAQQRARSQLEEARSREERLGAELQRRQVERSRLGKEESRLQGLQSEYDANPGRAGELLHRLNGQ